MRFFSSLLLIAALAACGSSDQTEQTETPVRGLRVFEVSTSASTMERRFPSIIQPAKESKLSFEISGQLGEVKLEVGEKVKAGDILLELDSTSLDLEVRQARAALEQAAAAQKNATTDFSRKSELLKTGNVTRAAYDSAESQLRSTQAQTEQSRQQLALAEEKLVKSTLKAPFSGIIASLEVESYNIVSPGNAILTLYSEGAFEVEFSVPATVINDLNIGDKANVEVTALNLSGLTGHIKELGSRAAQVSAFPVVVALEGTNANLKAGMSADVELAINLFGGEEGFLLPIHCFVLNVSGDPDTPRNLRDGTDKSRVFVFNPETNTVEARDVDVSGVRGNMVIVSGGLNVGELVASAGVSYLSDGQKVRRLPQTNQ